MLEFQTNLIKYDVINSTFGMVTLEYTPSVTHNIDFQLNLIIWKNNLYL